MKLSRLLMMVEVDSLVQEKGHGAHFHVPAKLAKRHPCIDPSFKLQLNQQKANNTSRTILVPHSSPIKPGFTAIAVEYYLLKDIDKAAHT